MEFDICKKPLGIDRDGWRVLRKSGCWAIKCKGKEIALCGAIKCGNVLDPEFEYCIDGDRIDEQDWIIEHIKSKQWPPPHDDADFLFLFEYLRDTM